MPPKTPGFALRRYPRSPVKAPLEFTGEDPRQVIFGFARDISVGGVFVETEFPVPAGSTVTVHIMLPGVPDETIVTGQVRWTRARAMGVRFVSVRDGDAQAIADHVAQWLESVEAVGTPVAPIARRRSA